MYLLIGVVDFSSTVIPLRLDLWMGSTTQRCNNRVQICLSTKPGNSKIVMDRSPSQNKAADRSELPGRKRCAMSCPLQCFFVEVCFRLCQKHCSQGDPVGVVFLVIQKGRCCTGMLRAWNFQVVTCNIYNHIYIINIDSWLLSTSWKLTFVFNSYITLLRPKSFAQESMLCGYNTSVSPECCAEWSSPGVHFVRRGDSSSLTLPKSKQTLI